MAIRDSMASVQALWRFLRANPQAFILLLICAVLGLGTFLVVIFSLASSGSATPNGEPSGLILGMRALIV